MEIFNFGVHNLAKWKQKKISKEREKKTLKMEKNCSKIFELMFCRQRRHV